MFITPVQLATILVELFPNLDVDNFWTSDEAALSYKQSNSIWQRVCSRFMSTKRERTLNKHARNIYDTFRNNFDKVKDTVIALRNNSHSLAAHNDHNNDSPNPYPKLKVISPAQPERIGVSAENLSSSNTENSDGSLHLAIISPKLEVDSLKFENNDSSGRNFDSFDTGSIISELDSFNFSANVGEVSPDLETADCLEDNFDAHQTISAHSDNAPIELLVKTENTDNSTSSDKSSTRHSQYAINDGKMVIPREFWAQFLDKNKMRLQKGWCDGFNKYFKNQYPHCVLAYEWHKCYTTKAPYFHAIAKCKNTSCTSFKFISMTPIVNPSHDPEINIYRNQEVCHDSGEIHRRFIRSSNRESIRKDLEGQSPSALKLKMLGDVAPDILESGNRDDAPSLILLQKMSSENNVKNDLDKDVTMFLLKLAEQFKDSWPGRYCSGYIQSHSINPFYVILYTEKQIRYLLSLPKPVFCNLDATGSIIERPFDSCKQIYYYALLVPGNDECAPLPLAEFISSVHNIPYLTMFLSVFNHTIKQMTNRRVVIDKIETDFSIALIQAVLQGFNGMSLSRYLDMQYAIIQDKSGVIPDFTHIHVCSTHVIRTVMRKSKTLFRGKEQRSMCAALIAQLIHCDEILTAQIIFRKAVRVFGCKEKIIDFDSLLHDIRNIEGINDTEFDDDDISQNDPGTDSVIDESQVTTQNLRHGSPFYSIFKSVYDDTESTEFSDNAGPISNEFYSPDFLLYLLEHILPFFPLWSAVALLPFNLSRDSNATAENWMKIVKINIFNGKLRISVPRFIQTMEPYILPRLLERKFSLKTERQRKNNRNMLDLEEEVWMRKRKSTTYFRTPKIKKQRDTVPVISDNLDDVPPENIVNVEYAPTDMTNAPLSITQISLPEPSISSEGKPSSALSYAKPLTITNAEEEATIFSPWMVYPYDFPQNPENKSVAGIILNDDSLQTLLPCRWLDDNVVNAFFVLVQDFANQNNMKVLSFESFFTQKLLEGRLSAGFKRWAEVTDIWAYDVWLLPVHFINHWTLLIVIFSHNVFLYLDSMHGNPPSHLIEEVCNFIESYRTARSKKITRWQNWSISVPSDIPSQFKSTKTLNSGGNCGVHVCSWAYTVCTSSFYPFTEDDMNTARKGISKWLLKQRNYVKRIERYKMREVVLEAPIHTPQIRGQKKIKLSRDPPLGFKTTLEYCATLKVLLDAVN